MSREYDTKIDTCDMCGEEQETLVEYNDVDGVILELWTCGCGEVNFREKEY